MTDNPDLRTRALEAMARAIGDAGYWLPPGGQAAAVDAVLGVLAAAESARCCVCGGTDVVYHNYRDQPFCLDCADGQGPTDRDGAHEMERPGASAPTGAHDMPPHAPVTDSTGPTPDARRAILFQTRIDAARDWARRNLTADQQTGLLEALGGQSPQPGQLALGWILAEAERQERYASEARTARSRRSYKVAAAAFRDAADFVRYSQIDAAADGQPTR